MKFKEYKDLNLSEVAKTVSVQWKDNSVFEKTISNRDQNNSFIFFEGPPSANGMPGIHHVMARTIKDVFCRYKTQKGYYVSRKAGWDTHGLPVELGTEKELNISKEDIGNKISVEDYNNACRKTVMRYTSSWKDLTDKMGYWVDMENPYITYKTKYIESVWWLLKQIHEKKSLYKGFSIQPYSPKAGTGLSSHELNQPGCYRDVVDTTIIAQFKAITTDNFNYDNLCFLAWTTTPWTLPSNTALAVNSQMDYAVVKTTNPYTNELCHVILAKDLVNKFFKEDNHTIITTCKGSDLVGMKYEQLMNLATPPNVENAFRVIAAEFVNSSNGTGIVHIAPTFGEDDAKAAKSANPEVPPFLVIENGKSTPLVDLQGKFVSCMGKYAGKYVKVEYTENQKSVDIEICVDLKESGKAFKIEKFTHSYPHCWRTDAPILYYPLDSWFINVSSVKDRMIELNSSINWKPESTGDGRFGNWLKSANDWNLSRSRYWGIPLPIWRTSDGSEELVVGSIEELRNEVAKAINAGVQHTDPFVNFNVNDMSDENYDSIDLHKNVVDQITLVSKSGKPMTRESDIIDVWFDSGAMPYAQLHYPFENKDKVNDCTADFIAEGIDQTRGWFYTLHVISTLVFDKPAYKNVISNGLVLDKNGQKMSKRLGNSIDPFQTLADHGADAVRWYMVSNSNPWDNLKFDMDGVVEARRKFFGTLHSSYSFFALYANIDGFTGLEKQLSLTERPVIDQWILSELHSLIKDTDNYYNNYEPTKAAVAISTFVQDFLSNWFIRLSRKRFWKNDYDNDKLSAFQTLYECLCTISQLAAPVAPFYMDKLYTDLTGNLSVHLTDYPVCNENYINKHLQQQMEKAMLISSLALSIRKKVNIKTRQPLQKLLVPTNDLDMVMDFIKTEVNVKEVLLSGNDTFVKKVKPNFKTIGPKFGKNANLIAKAIQLLTNAEISLLDNNKPVTVVVNNESYALDKEHVDIIVSDIEGWQTAKFNDVIVALDVTITDSLQEEYYVRELVGKLQSLRKECNFNVCDRITISINADEKLLSLVELNKQYIEKELLATIVISNEVSNFQLDIDGQLVTVAVKAE